MTIKLTAYGAYYDDAAGVWCTAQIPFGMIEERFLDWAKGPYHPVVGELINAIPQVRSAASRWRFFAWESGDHLPSDWRARVDRLIAEDHFFGRNAALAREDVAKYPLYKPEEVAAKAPITKAYKYTLAQCWYSGATKVDAGKALGNEAMEAVRALSRGKG